MVEKQSRFALMIADFIQKAHAMGYKFTFGEAYRTPEQAAINAKNGSGIKNSLHIKRLAVDLNAFHDGEYLTGNLPSHLPHLEALGVLWEKMGGTWGGRFKRKDYNHYSLEHEGVK